ncbi:MAG: VWA domain-containing protein [Planctomycetes bacterium]|nr:VWA domain-containing protein [Planctomycetota bacterium]
MVTTATGLAVAAAFVLVLAAELLHARRIRKVARLAFGPQGRPAAWVRGLPALRALGAALAVFGLATLLQIEPKVHASKGERERDPRHLVVLLDVSPSMRLDDAGPARKQRRNERSKELLESMFQRVSIGDYAVTIVAFANGAKPVVIDTHDAGVIDNILGDLPLYQAFQPGKTRLFDGLVEVARIAHDWRPESAILVVMSDGDTVPATGMPKMPPSIGSTLVVGVGDPVAGRFIDGKQSRQDVATLSQVAVRLGGRYHDGNEHHVPTDTVRALTAGAVDEKREKLTLREYALLALALGAALLVALPLLLQAFGTAWRPGLSAPNTSPLPRADEAPDEGRDEGRDEGLLPGAAEVR